MGYSTGHPRSGISGTGPLSGPPDFNMGGCGLGVGYGEGYGEGEGEGDGEGVGEGEGLATGPTGLSSLAGLS
jgi:hypothetical protein